MFDILKSKRKKIKEVYEYALQQTRKETHQAVEGLFHNLNTLNLWRAA